MLHLAKYPKSHSYVEGFGDLIEICCGQKSPYQSYQIYSISSVNCVNCLNSEAYQQVLIVLELKYEGKISAYYLDWCVGNPKR